MKKLLAPIILVLLSTTSAAETKNIAQPIESFIKSHLPYEQVGVVLQDAQKGNIIYQRLADHYFYPASNTKILTAVAALKTLGPDFRFQTDLFTYKNDVYLKFNGDPSLSLADVIQLIAHLKTKPNTTLLGNFYIVDENFSDSYYAQGWTLDSMPWYYSAPISGIIVNENKTALTIEKANGLNKPVKFKHKASFPHLKISSDVVGVTKMVAERDCQLTISQSQNVFKIAGCWPIEKTPLTIEVALQDPNYTALEAIKNGLAVHNIQLEGKILFGTVPKEAKKIATHHSLPLSDLLKPVLSDSNNTYTDAITKTLGLIYKREGSFLQGVNVIKDTLNEQYNFPTNEYKLYDGSGVSRYTLLSPTYLAELLYQIYHDQNFSVFEAALSHSGKNGSLQYRMDKNPLKGNIAAKTGTAMGTTALSGYLKAKSGKTIVFTFIVNQSLESIAQLKQLETNFLFMLYDNL